MGINRRGFVSGLVATFAAPLGRLCGMPTAVSELARTRKYINGAGLLYGVFTPSPSWIVDALDLADGLKVGDTVRIKLP